MQRAGQKRKFLAGKLNSTLEYVRFETEVQIKIEPEEHLPACCLCKNSSGIKLLALFGNASKRADPNTVEKIKICIGREMSTETNAMLCSLCLKQLNAHHGFWEKALQCNDYAQIRKVEITENPTKTQICRFCSKVGGTLLNLFPKGRAAKEQHLTKIRDCLGVQINSWDPVTNVCRTCIHRVQKYLDFQAQYVPVSLHTEQAHAPSLVSPLNGLKQEEAQNNSHSAQDTNQRKYPSKCGKLKPEAIRMEIVQLLATELEGRNFSVILENGARLKVNFEGYQFRFHSMNFSGSSVWYCLESKLWQCAVKLTIDPKGRRASITSKRRNHSHTVIPPKLMECPMGKGFIQYGDVKEPFWMFNSRQMDNNQTRSLILAGFRYFLHRFNRRKPQSIWHCGRRRTATCLAVLEVEAIFQSVQMKGTHNHEAMEQDNLDAVLKGCAIDLETTEAIDTFQKDNQFQDVKPIQRIVAAAKVQEQSAMNSLLKEKSPDMFQILQEADPERNFECVNAGSKLKVKKDGFEYRYYGTQEDESTLWKCIMNSLHHCAMIVKVSGDGKQMETFEGSRHSHLVEPAAIFNYPLGKRVVGDEPLWMLKRVSMYHESRYVIYRDYVYILQEANQTGVVRWLCLKKHKCRALLVVNGDFEEVCLRKGHSHDKAPQEELQKMIGGCLDQLNTDKNLTFKQRLLSFPSMTGKIWDEVRDEYGTFYVLHERKTGDRIGYGLTFRGFRYTFASLDQFGTSRWTCMKQDECRAMAIVEGMYESIYMKEEHSHEMMSDSELDLLIQRCTNTLCDAPESSCLVEHSEKDYEPNNVLSILARKDPDRNFAVSRMKAKLLIHYNEEDFRLAIRKPDGTSSWSCVWQKLRKCPVFLHLSADGKQVSIVDPKKKHNHSEEQVAIFYLACGKAPVYDEYICANRSYWLFSCQSEYRMNRGIIYQGYKYYLHAIGNNRMSTWQCRTQNCRAFVRVEDCLKVISCKNKHTHGPLSDEEILALTGLTEVDKDLLEDSESLESGLILDKDAPIRPLALLNILAENDLDRNFQASIYREKMKICQNGYEYYYHSSGASHSFWKCVYSVIRRCRAVLHVDNHCKVGFLPKLPKHNHQVEQWELFRYPLGKHSIMDSQTETLKPFWYLMPSSFLRSCPVLIYDQNKFHLTFINEKGDSTKWLCAVPQCSVTVTVTGLFELIAANASQHNHEHPSEKKIATWIRIHGSGVEEREHKADVKCGSQITICKDEL